MSEELKTFKVLIVDDVGSVRLSLGNHLKNHHSKIYSNYIVEPHMAKDGFEALEKVENEKFDLVISDIIMPNMNGLELISSLSRKFPDLCTVLMTSADVEDYIKMALVYNITNIITKTNPFNYEEFSRVVHNLLTKENIFGLGYYMEPNIKIESVKIDSKECIRCVIDKIRDVASDTFVDNSTVKKFVLSTEEAILNACIYASLENVTRERPKFSAFFDLDNFGSVNVSYGVDSEKLGISIIDSGGKLKKEDILYWISRNISGEGILDNHGRGLFLMRVNTDRMIINVDPGHNTEVILIKYFKEIYEGYKPLYINQV